MLGLVSRPKEVDWSLIQKCADEQEAILLCVHLSRLANEEIAHQLGIDKGHWTRIMQGRGNLPARKRTQLMSICGNLAPLQYDAMRFGYTLSFTDLEQAEKDALAVLARVRQQKERLAA